MRDVIGYKSLQTDRTANSPELPSHLIDRRMIEDFGFSEDKIQNPDELLNLKQYVENLVTGPNEHIANHALERLSKIHTNPQLANQIHNRIIQISGQFGRATLLLGADSNRAHITAFGTESNHLKSLTDLQELLRIKGIQVDKVDDFASAKTSQEQIISAIGYQNLVSNALAAGQSAQQAHSQAMATMKSPGWLDSQRTRLGLPPRTLITQVLTNSSNTQQTGTPSSLTTDLGSTVVALLRDNPGLAQQLLTLINTLSPEQKKAFKADIQRVSTLAQLEKLMATFETTVQAASNAGSTRKK
jgi:hypothetical protein